MLYTLRHEERETNDLGEDVDALTQQVAHVYDQLAAEYDERVPGSGPRDRLFAETESSYIRQELDGVKRILDLGCGTGRLSIAMAKAGYEVIGIDLSDGMLAQASARARAAEVDLELRQGNMKDMPFEANSFDAVVSTLALMHLPTTTRDRAFSEVSRVLRPGGVFVFGVKNSIFERMSTADRFVSIDVTDAPRRILRFTQTARGKDYEAHWASFTPSTLQRLSAQAGMEITGFRGNSFLSAWLPDWLLKLPAGYSAIASIERLFGDVPPFSHLGYYTLAVATKRAEPAQGPAPR